MTNHSPAESEDGRQVRDLNSLHLSLYMTGTLRQLVGADLLQEIKCQVCGWMLQALLD
jgi:hypothetical protein